jgi:hypothetical protein
MDSAFAAFPESTGKRFRRHLRLPYTRINRFISSKGTDVSRDGSLDFATCFEGGGGAFFGGALLIAHVALMAVIVVCPVAGEKNAVWAGIGSKDV